MKKLFILTVIFMKASFSFSQEVKSLNQECNPTFKEIFNFQVGDYFNYEINEWQESWGGGIKKNESYTITKKEEHGDTVYYVRKGKVTEIDENPIGPGPWPPPSIRKYEINDTLVYVDSANHFLNACPDSLIPVASLMTCFCQDSDYYSRVQVVQNDSMLTKIIGGYHNFYVYQSTGTTDTVEVGFMDCALFDEVYAKGLGLVEQNINNFLCNYKYYRRLIGYIQGTDTVGIISSLPPGKKIQSGVKIYPNPVKDELNIQVDNTVYLINIYTLTGELVYAKPIFNSEANILSIHINDIKKGLYLLELVGKNKYTVKFEKL
jgi:hypothetical protein